MLVSNMVSVFKVFFRGMTTVRVKQIKFAEKRKLALESSLDVLEKRNIIATRIRKDTRVK